MKDLELLKCLRTIQDMCIGEIAMDYRLDATAIGQMITDATGMTFPELSKYISEHEDENSNCK